MNRKRKFLAALTVLYLAVPASLLVYDWVRFGWSTVVVFTLLAVFFLATRRRSLTTTPSRVERSLSSIVAGLFVGSCAAGLAFAIKDLPGIPVSPDQLLVPIFFGAWILSAVAFSIWPSSAASRRAIWTFAGRTIAVSGAATLAAGVVIFRIAGQRWVWIHWSALAIDIGGTAMYWAVGVLLYSAWRTIGVGPLDRAVGKAPTPSTGADQTT